MVKRKACYRVQVGDLYFGLVSKCLTKKEAEWMQGKIDKGEILSWVLTPSESPFPSMVLKKKRIGGGKGCLW